MADTETALLCVEIIRADFGPLTASVASALLTRGRLTIFQLVRFTSLKPRIVRAAILILVQHNLVWHTRTEDDGEVLELNVDECLTRIRFGRFVWQAGELFGKTAAAIIEAILDHGKLRPPQILSYMTKHNPKNLSVSTRALYSLVTSSYLKPSTIFSHISPRDKLLKYEAEEIARISGLPAAKALRHAKEVAEARIKREEEEAGKIGLKRKPRDTPEHRSAKRQAIEEEVVDDDVYFRVNVEKFNIHIRNSLIETAARERFNDGAAAVIRATLKATESKQLSIAEVRSDPTSIASIAQQLPDDEDLMSGLFLSSSQQKASNISQIKDYIGMLASADNPTLTGRASSFVSLASSKVQVEFDIIGQRLRKRVLEAVTRERHGDNGVRILRLLLETGKMDEKQISKVAMIAAKEVRPLLSALSIDSLVSLQEVPKSADRNPTRTFYLWYVDLHKAYSVLLSSMYKTLYNIHMRRHAEEQEPVLRAVLEKRQRSDVSEDETLLTKMERDVLKEWETRREKLMVLEMRVDEAVFILRDLGVLGIEYD